MADRRKVVCHVTSLHVPNDPRVCQRECRSLAENGYRVILVAPKNRSQLPEFDNLEVETVEIPSNRGLRICTSWYRIWNAARRWNPALVHIHDPELIPTGFLFKLTGKRVIYDAHEDLPAQVLQKEWLPRGLRVLIALLARLMLGGVSLVYDGVVAATPLIQKTFPPRKTVTARNYPPLRELLSLPANGQSKRMPHIIYIGGLSRIRGISEVVDAFAKLDDIQSAKLILVGAFDDKEFEDQVRRKADPSRVEIRGWVERDEALRELATAAIGVCTLYPTPNHLHSLPVKLFEYMGAGLAVVVSRLTEVDRIVRGSKCGLLVNCYDANAIAAAFRKLLLDPSLVQSMGQAGRDAVLMHYHWECELPAFLGLYDRLLSPCRA